MTSTPTMKKAEVAAVYAVTPRTIDNWMKVGRIPYLKIGKVVRFDPLKVAAALARCEIGS